MDFIVRIVMLLLYLGLLYSLVFYFLTFLEKFNGFKKEDNAKPKPLKAYPLVTIAVPAYNEGETIYRTISSITKLNYPKGKLQIIVVNDGSTDNTKAEANRAIRNFRGYNIVLINQRNQGKAAALNKALELAEGRYFACLDGDSVIEPTTLTKMVRLFSENGPELAVVTPAMKVKEPKNLLQKLQRIEYLVSILLQRLLAKMDSLYVAPGPFSVYKTAIIKALGGFDYNNLTEDQEIAYRMQYHNYRIGHCHDAYVYTECPKSVWTLFRQRNRWNKGSLINLFKYKKMLLNKDYGNFGVFQMPFNLFSFLLGAGAMFFFVYFSIRPLVRMLRNLYLIDFDIPTLLRNFRFDFTFLDLNLGLGFIVLMIFLFTFIVLLFAHRNAKEKLVARGIVPLFGYFVMYYLLLGLFCCMAIIELGIGRKQRW